MAVKTNLIPEEIPENLRDQTGQSDLFKKKSDNLR
jgi:hypothetical protein